MLTKQTLANNHNFLSEAVFHLKSRLLIAKRLFVNTVTPKQKLYHNKSLKQQAVVSVSESELWNADDNAENWILTAGKIENLRIAVKKINGVEIDAGQVFSFWKYVGSPNKLKGYVLGREIREGCIVPTIAGGLCQLSNGLYDAALKANFDIIERHKHTRVIKGSLAEQDRDATVKWNYIDLRFKANKPFRIEAELTADKLIIKFRSGGTGVTSEIDYATKLKPSQLNDCYSCGNFGCFNYPNPDKRASAKPITTFVLDEKWNEYNDYINKQASGDDYFIVPIHQSKFIRLNRYNWVIATNAKVKTLPLVAVKRAISLRLFAKGNVFKQALNFDRQLAKAASKNIPIECTHLVIAQNLLPFMFEYGALGGRTFDVLMNRLPFEQLHQCLNHAHTIHSRSETLNDFRAPANWVEFECIALTKARHIVTPHQQIANIFNNKAVKLNWALPNIGKKPLAGNKILFPASAVGRKGAYEIKQLATELNLALVVTGKATEYENFWDGVKTEPAGQNILDGIGLVIYPAYVEHRPVMLLKALAAGIPVITTTACGLQAHPNLTILPTGNFELLKQTVELYLSKSKTFDTLNT
ncbi:VanW like protein [Mucilaginibacter gracilis]|uniref:VanW like protein n=1 Tax=Mucilaginibacter gracilis TaxID=423350 RepID=A0A495J601_9SPHI|nr:VanW family protein [Mucilaginibacter gracilis]RKR83848.1 VanW like protein [Mucilaginibacter gracilis]